MLRQVCECGCQEEFESRRVKRFKNRTHARRAQRQARRKEEADRERDERLGKGAADRIIPDAGPSERDPWADEPHWRPWPVNNEY
jgi:hypothetical protein